MRCPPPKEQLEPPEAGRGGEGPSPRAFRESKAQPTPRFRALSLRAGREHMCIASQSGSDHLLQQPQETDTPGKWQGGDSNQAYPAPNYHVSPPPARRARLVSLPGSVASSFKWSRSHSPPKAEEGPGNSVWQACGRIAPTTQSSPAPSQSSEYIIQFAPRMALECNLWLFCPRAKDK